MECILVKSGQPFATAKAVRRVNSCVFSIPVGGANKPLETVAAGDFSRFIRGVCVEAFCLRQNKRKGGPAVSQEKKQNLQDTFLNSVRKSKTPLTIFLVNGVKLQGVVTWFDNFCVLLRRDGQSQLVYKHAISTIMPSAPVQLYEPDAENGEE
jgi:host factor-I protein